MSTTSLDQTTATEETASGFFLPVLGISVIVWIVGEQLVTRLRKG